MTQYFIVTKLQVLTVGHVTDLGDAHGVLRSTADEVKLAEPPHLHGPVGRSSAAYRLVEGVAASLTGGGPHPLWDRQTGSTWTSHSLKVLQSIHSQIVILHPGFQ